MADNNAAVLAAIDTILSNSGGGSSSKKTADQMNTPDSDFTVWVGHDKGYQTGSGVYKKKKYVKASQIMGEFDRLQSDNYTRPNAGYQSIVSRLVKSGRLLPQWATYPSSVRKAYYASLVSYSQGSQDVSFNNWITTPKLTADKSSSSGGGGYGAPAGPTPQQLAQQRRQTRAEIRQIAGENGIDLSRKEVARLARIQQKKNLSATELNNRIINKLEMDDDGNLSGVAGTVQDELVMWAANNGLSLSDNQIVKYAGQVMRKENDLNGIKADLRKTYLSGAYPAWSDRIANGEDIADIAAPYMGTAAKMLEVDKVGIGDTLIKQGLQSVGADGKPRVMPLYEFEQKVRNDPRWLNTDNARTTYMNAAQAIARKFGLA